MAAPARTRSTKAGNDERDRVQRILSTRDGYEEELVRHRFLLDAYSGTGGFQGRVRQPFAGFWGAAAEIYASGVLSDAFVDPEAQIDTYLDRFPREDTEKFKRRAAAAHYPNYIAPAVDVPLSFLFRREMAREPAKSTDNLDRWMGNANGSGETWEKQLREVVALRGMILGWCPALLSMPAPKGMRQGRDGTPYRTKADDIAENRMPRMMPLFPSNLLDWYVDDEGITRWVKTRVDYTRREDPLGKCEKLSRVTVWMREIEDYEPTKVEGAVPDADLLLGGAPSVWWYDLSWEDGEARVVGEGKGRHGFGDVPIPIFRRKPVPDDPMRGIPHAGSASDECRRLFNLCSEVDHHLRSSTFAFLQYPVKSGKTVGSVKLGSGNALPLDMESKHEFKFVSPDGAVCTAYENRIAKTIEEVYRIQKMEFTRGTTTAQSGTARSFEFESTNRMIADIAAQAAAFDEQVRRLVSRQMDGYAPGSDEERAIRTIPASRFDVAEMLKEIEEAQAAIDLGLGPTATTHIKKRIALSLLPNLSDEEKEKIESEIEQLAADEEEAKKQAVAAEQAARDALLNGDKGASPFGDEDDQEGGPGAGNEPPGAKPPAPFPPKKGAPPGKKPPSKKKGAPPFA